MPFTLWVVACGGRPLLASPLCGMSAQVPPPFIEWEDVDVVDAPPSWLQRVAVFLMSFSAVIVAARCLVAGPASATCTAATPGPAARPRKRD